MCHPAKARDARNPRVSDLAIVWVKSKHAQMAGSPNCLFRCYFRGGSASSFAVAEGRQPRFHTAWCSSYGPRTCYRRLIVQQSTAELNASLVRVSHPSHRVIKWPGKAPTP